MGCLAGLKTSLCHCIPIHIAVCREEAKPEDPLTRSCWRKNKITPTSVQRLNSSESDHNGPSLEKPSPLPSELLPFFKELKGHLFLPLHSKAALKLGFEHSLPTPLTSPDPHCGVMEKAKPPRMRPLRKPDPRGEGT